MDAFERGVRLSTWELLALYSQNKGEEEKQKTLLSCSQHQNSVSK